MLPVTNANHATTRATVVLVRVFGSEFLQNLSLSVGQPHPLSLSDILFPARTIALTPVLNKAMNTDSTIRDEPRLVKKTLL